jgi:hypothetical protein
MLHASAPARETPFRGDGGGGGEGEGDEAVAINNFGQATKCGRGMQMNVQLVFLV